MTGASAVTEQPEAPDARALQLRRAIGFQFPGAPQSSEAGQQTLSDQDLFGTSAPSGSGEQIEFQDADLFGDKPYQAAAVPEAPKRKGAGANLAAGANTAVANNPLSMAVDATNYVLGELGLPVSKTPFGGSEFVKQAMGAGGFNPDEVSADTQFDKILRGAGEGGASLPLMAAPLAAGTRAVKSVSEPVRKMIADLLSPSAATAGAAGGAGGKFASEAVPEGAKVDLIPGKLYLGGQSAADLAGNILAGGPVAAATQGVRYVAGAARRGIADLLSQFSETGQRSAAAKKLAQKAGMAPQTLTDILRTSEGELIPGSVPTTAEMTQIPGLMVEQRAQAAGPAAGAFQAQRETRGQALTGAVEKLVPAGSDPTAVRRAFQAHLEALDRSSADTLAEIDRLQQQFRTGVQQSQAGTRDAARDIQGRLAEGVQKTQADTLSNARGQAATLLEGAGGRGEAGDYGAIVRDATQAARNQEKVHLEALRQQIDPEGKLALDVTTAQQSVKTMLDGLPEASKGRVSGDEKALYDTLAGMKPVQSLAEIMGLRQELRAEMAKERMAARGANTPKLARLAQAHDAVMGLLTGALDNGASQAARSAPEALVAAGYTAATDAEGRVIGYRSPDGSHTITGAAGRKAPPSEQAEKGLGSAPDERASANPAGSGHEGVPGVRGAPGAPGLARRQSGANPHRASGESGRGEGAGPAAATAPAAAEVQGGADPEALGRYNQWRGKYRNYAQTFKEGPVRDVLAEQGEKGRYRLVDSQVAGRFFNSTPRSPNDLQAFFKAVGNEGHAVEALKDYAGWSLRNAAMRADGTLDPAKYAAWVKRHEPALLELARSGHPEVAAKFRTAADAQAAVDELIKRQPKEAKAYTADQAEQAKALEKEGAAAEKGFGERQTEERAAVAKDLAERKREFEKGAARFFLGAEPGQAIEAALGSKNPIQSLRQLVVLAAENAEARDGLKRALIDHILTMAKGEGTESLKPEVFQRLVRQRATELRTVLGDGAMRTLNAVADELQRGAKIAAAKQSGSPGTAMELSHQNGAKNHSMMSVVGGMLISEHAGWKAVPVLLTKALWDRLAGSAQQKIAGLLSEAILKPEVARDLLASLDRNNQPGVIARLYRDLFPGEITMPKGGLPEMGARARRAVTQTSVVPLNIDLNPKRKPPANSREAIAQTLMGAR